MAIATLIQRLRIAKSDLPESLRAAIVALGGDAIPPLVRLLDAAATSDEAQGPGAPQPCAECGAPHDHEWPRFHAVDLLTELGAPAGIDAMLEVLARTPCEDPIHDKIVERLPDLGDAALEPVVAALARTTKGSDTAESLCCILSALGVRDERILHALLELLAVRPRAGSVYLSEYGDPAACPAILAVITTARPDVDDATARLEFLDIVDAFTSLGGEMPPAEKARIESWLAGEGTALKLERIS